jgi:hypothetical protein
LERSKKRNLEGILLLFSLFTLFFTKSIIRSFNLTRLCCFLVLLSFPSHISSIVVFHSNPIRFPFYHLHWSTNKILKIRYHHVFVLFYVSLPYWLLFYYFSCWMLRKNYKIFTSTCVFQYHTLLALSSVFCGLFLVCHIQAFLA